MENQFEISIGRIRRETVPGKRFSWVYVLWDGIPGLQIFHGDWISFIPLSEIEKARKEHNEQFCHQ